MWDIEKNPKGKMEFYLYSHRIWKPDMTSETPNTVAALQCGWGQARRCAQQ